MADQQSLTVEGFDGLPEDQAREALLPACASTRWVAQVAAGRPYASLAEVRSASDRAIEALQWDDLLEALAAHPRIGDQAEGADRESAWSRQEQSSTATAAADVTAALRSANLAYEQRFGFVFLICATGLSAEQMLAAAQARVRNDEATEQEVVRDELTKIVRLRLAKTFDS